MNINRLIVLSLAALPISLNAAWSADVCTNTMVRLVLLKTAVSLAFCIAMLSLAATTYAGTIVHRSWIEVASNP